MIAFGYVHHEARRLPALRRAGHPPRRRAGLAGRSRAPATGSIFRSYNALARARPPPARTSRRSCSSTRTPRSSTRTCARRCGARCRSRRRRRRLRRRGRRAQHRLVGGRRSRSPRSSTATRSTAAATSQSFSWAWDDAPPYAQTGEVETLDGFLLALSPWAVRNIRFDEALGGFHGYDLDFCLQVREAGRKVVTADFRAIHHRPLEMVPDPEQWVEAHMRGRREVGRPHAGHRHARRAAGSERALRAEAERDLARAIAHCEGARARGARAASSSARSPRRAAASPGG